MKTVLVVGSANLDHVYRVRQIPAPGMTVAATGYQTFPGGKGMNQAVACARSGAQVVFCGSVGDDDAGSALLQVLQESGVDVSHVVRSEVPTGNASILVADDGTNLITVAGGSNAALDTGHVEKTLAAVRPDAVLAQLETNMPCVEAASRHPMFILNPAPAAALPDRLLRRCFAVTPNETEAESLTGVAPVDEASTLRCGERLREQGAQNVVVTLGEKGSFWLGADGPAMVGTPRVSPVDTTAAGDVFNGALVAALMLGDDFAGALRYASQAAALSTTRMGAISSVPTRAEVEAAFG
ncbi:MAG: ribokinase [Fimbriimonadaceae bacterium]|nr:ribokinase [Fimbriimonadaceae bacterium]